MMETRLRGAALLLTALLALGGCTSARSTNTARTANEQLLISNSVDQALDKVNFRPLSGHAVFLDEKYLECVDKNYVIASIRHRVLNAGGTIASKAEDAEIVLEVRAGAVGTDTSETFLGVPKIDLPVPMPIAIPEIKLLSRSRQTGTAKLGIVAYDTRQNRKLGEGGMTVARSDDNSWFVLGMGPYQNGTVRSEMARSLTTEGSTAGGSGAAGGRTPGSGGLPTTVAFNTRGLNTAAPGVPATPGQTEAAGEVRLASESEEPPPAASPAEDPPSRPLPTIQQLNRALFMP